MDAVSADSFGALILCASRFPDLSSVRLGLRENVSWRVEIPHPSQQGFDIEDVALNPRGRILSGGRELICLF
jgi:hypothetical protein